jgi:tetratricopeptide (TPR) repeat protein
VRYRLPKTRLYLIRSIWFVSGISLAGSSSAQIHDLLGLGDNHAIVATSGSNASTPRPVDGGRSEAAQPGAARTSSPDYQRTNIQGTSNASGPIEQVADAGTQTSLDMIAPRAQAHISYALELAERGAVESAQAEFRTALELVAEALDADTKNAARAHARAVKSGLTAIEEANDFVSEDAASDIDTNLSQFAAIHHTPILKQANAAGMTRAEALQRYHMYATQQLAFAGGHSAIASSALYGLGRAESTNAAGAGVHNPLGGANAISFYQAALHVDPQNYVAANELGVLMARYGDLAAAQEQFVRSLTVHPQPETWHNLAAVYRYMGQNEKAAQADAEREKLVAAAREAGVTNAVAAGGVTKPLLRWVDVDTFAASGTPYGLDGPAINSSTSGKAVASTQQESIGKRLMAKLTSWPRSSKTAPTENDKQQPAQQDYLSRGDSNTDRQ